MHKCIFYVQTQNHTITTTTNYKRIGGKGNKSIKIFFKSSLDDAHKTEEKEMFFPHHIT